MNNYQIFHVNSTRDRDVGLLPCFRRIMVVYFSCGSYRSILNFLYEKRMAIWMK